MKKILALLFLLCAIESRAQIITAQLVITNGTVNGETITINGTLRYFTNVVNFTPIQILTNSTIVGVQSNVFNAYAVSPASGVQLQQVSTNQINFQSLPGVALTASVGTGWATMTLSTNTPTDVFSMRAPPYATAISVIGSTERSNTESAIAKYLNDGLANLGVSGSAINGGTLTNTAITNAPYISGNGGNETNMILVNPVLTNGINNGNAFSSPGVGFGSEEFGNGAVANNSAATAIGPNSAASGSASFAGGNLASASGANSTASGANTTASGPQSSAYGRTATASNTNSTSLGTSSSATGPNSTAVGAFATASGTNSTAIGQGSTSSATGTSAFGSGATTTGANSITIGTGSSETATNAMAIGNFVANSTPNEITMGSGSQYVRMAGNMVVTGTINSNLTTLGPSTFLGTNTLGGVICFSGTNNSTLANGNNAGVLVGTNETLVVSGPSATFTICGIVPQGGDRQQITIENSTGFNMVLANQSGVDATPGNRIKTGLNADRTFTNNPGVVTLRYSTAVSRWIVSGAN